jgi:secreted trypsin-like serine protease
LIINGENAPDKRYSFAQVSLMLNVANDESPYDHQCGGSIVAPGVILSAAHCRQWFSDIDIDRFNFVDRTDEYEVVHASNIIVHPSYESETYRYDYMLIQTDKQFSTSDAPPIRLNSDPNYPTGGQDLTVLGWGTTDHSDPNKPVFPSILQKGKLKYINNDECQSTVIANKALYEGEVFPEMLCAKSNRGVDACSGDSGGPLIVEGSDEGEDLLVGIVSWGRGCAIYPGVYSRVSSGYSWIRSQICISIVHQVSEILSIL